MGYLRIKCHECGNYYVLYGDMVQHKDANCCPFCFSEMRRSVWEKVVIPAFGAFEDANRDLLNEHTGYDDVPLMQIEYGTGKLPRNVRR